jgi:hypothetical protein
MAYAVWYIFTSILEEPAAFIFKADLPENMVSHPRRQ